MTRSSEATSAGLLFRPERTAPGGIPDARFCHRIGRNAFGGYNEATEQISAPGLKAFEERRHFAHVVAARGVLLLSGVIGAGVDGVVASDPAEQF